MSLVALHAVGSQPLLSGRRGKGKKLGRRIASSTIYMHSESSSKKYLMVVYTFHVFLTAPTLATSRSYLLYIVQTISQVNSNNFLSLSSSRRDQEINECRILRLAIHLERPDEDTRRNFERQSGRPLPPSRLLETRPPL